MNAVERYDALQGTAFTTYAVQRIRGAMLDELRSRDWVPRSAAAPCAQVAQVMRQLEQRYGRPASETEVAQTLNISLDEYRQILLDTNNSQLFSYDEWREEHGENAEPMLEGHEEANPLHHLLEGSLRQRVIDAIEALPEREKNGADAVLPGRVESQRDRRRAGRRGIPRQPIAQSGDQTAARAAGERYLTAAHRPSTR